MRRFLSILCTLLLAFSILTQAYASELVDLSGVQFETNDASVEMIEVNQVMSYGQSIEDGSLYPMESFVAGKDTLVIVRMNGEVDAVSDGSQRLTIDRDGSEIAQVLPQDMEDTDRLYFTINMRDVDNWAAGEYIFRYSDENGTTASRAVTFQPTKSIKILAVPVVANYRGTIQEVSDDWKTAISFTQKTYPLAKGSIEYVLSPVLDLSDDAYDLTTDDGMFAVWQALADLQTPNSDYELILGFVRDRQGDGSIQGYTYGSPATIITESDGDMRATVAHEIAHCYAVGDEYDGGTLNEEVNPAPYGMEGYDWNDTEEIVRSNKKFVVGGQDVGMEASGSVIPVEQLPVDISEYEILYNNVTSFMGSGSSNEKDYWITSAIWEQLFRYFSTSSTFSGSAQSSQSSDELLGWLGGLFGETDQTDAQDETTVEDETVEDTQGDDEQLLADCNQCGKTIDLFACDLYVLCSSCGEMTPASWEEDACFCDYCDEENEIDLDNTYLACPICGKLTKLSNYFSDCLSKVAAMKQDQAEDTQETQTEVEATPTFRVIDIKGTLSRDGTFTPSPFFAYEVEEPDYCVKGDYAVQMRDETGKVISQYRFDMSFYSNSNPPKKLDFAPVNLTVRFPERTRSIALLKGDQELWSQTLSEHSPEIAFTGLEEDQSADGKMTINWQAQDADGDALYYELWYANDQGDLISLGTNLTETSKEVDFNTLPGSDLAYLYLYATDGVNTTGIDSPYLRVRYKAPEVLSKQETIPEYRITDEIQFDVDVYDMQDGWLFEDDEIVWTDERGGEYTTGSLLWIYPYEFAPGDHSFTMTATNSMGVSTQAQFTFRIVDDESALPDDWSREDIKQALSNGFIAPLAKVGAPITRGQYARLMTTMYFTLMDEDASIPDYEEGMVTDCGVDDYDQFLMVKLGVMQAPDGRFSPNDSLLEEEAMRVLYEVAIKALGTDDGTENAIEDILTELRDAGVIDDQAENSYQASQKITGRLALVRCNRLVEYFFSDEE